MVRDIEDKISAKTIAKLIGDVNQQQQRKDS